MAKQEQTLGTYESSSYGQELFVAPAKGAKTTTLIGNILGVMPWQENGGIVDKPENLHVISFDAAAVAGVMEFLTQECGASKDIGKVHIENMQAAAKKAFTSPNDYDGTFLNTLYETIRKVQDRCARPGVHVVMFCSLTMAAKAILRGISGPAFIMKGNSMGKSPMDQNKWNLLKQQLTELQWSVQQDNYHTFWEGHHGEKISKETNNSGDTKTVDTIQMDGGAARTLPAQVERIWEIKRSPSRWTDPKSKKPTKINLVDFDAFPMFDFGNIQTGRKVSSCLEAKEPDLTVAFHKLGLKIGGWGT